MKKCIIKYLFLGFSVMMTEISCQELIDENYYKNIATPNSSTSVYSTSLTSSEYISSRSDFSKMEGLFKSQGILKELEDANRPYTILVVPDSSYVNPDVNDLTSFAKGYVSSLTIVPSKLKEIERLLMLNRKNVAITFEGNADDELIGNTKFKTADLLEIIKTSNGYIYVISELLSTRPTLMDFVEDLDDKKYGKFKSMVLPSDARVMDTDESKIVGIDKYGNNVYDTIWTDYIPFFEAKNFKLSSESINGTMFYFSDEVINQAMNEAMDKLTRWGYNHKTALLRNGSLDSVFVGYSSYEDLENWILEAAFYRKNYSAEQIQALSESDAPDMTSIYDRKWRTNIQELDLENPVELSNGVAYEVKSFRIPTNRLIYRLHEEFRYYNLCSADQQAEYFKMSNFGTIEVKHKLDGWNPREGYWPDHETNVLECKMASGMTSYTFEFTPLYCRDNGDGSVDIGPMLVPPGEYKFRMGFEESKSMSGTLVIKVGVYVSPEDIEWFFTSNPIVISSQGTAYKWDRGTMSSKPFHPEYYDSSDANNTAGSKNANYWTDGGTITDNLVVPDLKNGNSERLVIKIDGTEATTNQVFNHWCLRPTDNNY